MEEISDIQVAHFRGHGFFLIANPLGGENMRQVERVQQDVAGEWEETEWPAGFNRMACQFFMVGEVLLQLVEKPQLLDMARRILDCDQVQIGACGIGDASKVVSEDGRPQRQVHWHADGGPGDRQVSLRTALDRHDPTNAPLRVLPGSQRREREEVEQELLQLELATGRHDELPSQYFARHPHEVEVQLDPRWSLVWTPSCWHATGVKTAAGPRRAMSWNYYPPGGRTRDVEALKYVFEGVWQDWTDERKTLWGLTE